MRSTTERGTYLDINLRGRTFSRLVGYVRSTVPVIFPSRPPIER